MSFRTSQGSARRDPESRRKRFAPGFRLGGRNDKLLDNSMGEVEIKQEYREQEKITVCKALIQRGDKILVLLRNSKHFDKLWDLPGGKLDYGESNEQAVTREVTEETGLSVGSPVLAHTYDGDLNGIPIAGHVYSVEVIGSIDSVMLSKDHSDYKFLTKEEVSQLPNVMPYMRELLAKL